MKALRAKVIFAAVAIVLMGFVTPSLAWADAKPSPSGVSSPPQYVPGGFASWRELLTMQKRLNAAADRITAAKADGFAGIIAAPENRELRLYWNGKPPASINDLVSQVRMSVPVSIFPAAYSEAQLRAETVRLTRIPGVISVAPKADGSGLTVATDASITAVATDVAIERINSRPALASRGDDFAPYWGGARWNYCSTGFSVLIGTGSAMMSAGHCANNGDSAWDGGGQYMGAVSGDDNTYDRLLINTYSQGRIYDGGVGVGEFSKPVVGAQANIPGNWVCTSGAYSGAICSIQITAVNQAIYAGYWVFGLTAAEQSAHHNAAGSGDSGGPVFGLTPDWSGVIAQGMITAGDLTTSVPCTGIPEGPSRVCSWRIYYSDVLSALSAYGATILTG